MRTKTKIKVSVLVANYNNKIYLKNCIDSILNQSYKNLEIIVIDDSSTDNSNEVLNKYKKKIKIIRKREKKKGVGFYDQIISYYECFKKSKGEIIFFCDSDDYFKKNKISTIVKKFDSNENFQLIFDLPIIKKRNNYDNVKLKKKFFKTYWPYFPPTSCISLKRNIFSEFMKELRDLKFDYLWMDFRLGVFSKYYLKRIYYLNNNLTIYRQTNNNISSKFRYLSKNWWIRRNQAHEYIKLIFKRKKINHIKNYDYILTKFINFVL